MVLTTDTRALDAVSAVQATVARSVSRPKASWMTAVAGCPVTVVTYSIFFEPTGSALHHGRLLQRRTFRNPSSAEYPRGHETPPFAQIRTGPHPGRPPNLADIASSQGCEPWAHPCATSRRPGDSSRRRATGATAPEATLLYRLVAEHYPVFRDQRAAEGAAAASVRGGRIRGLPPMRAARARLSARALRGLPRREARGLQLQASRVLSELRRAADG